MAVIMKRAQMRLMILLVVLAFCATLYHPARAVENKAPADPAHMKAGSVAGVLVDENGMPVSALVTALRFEGIENNRPKTGFYYIEGRLPEDRTDRTGRFRIALPVGQWVLRTTVGKFDRGDYIRKRTDNKETLLIVDINDGRKVDIGKIHVNTKVPDLNYIPPSVIPLMNGM